MGLLVKDPGIAAKTFSIEDFELLCGQVLTKAVHKLVNLTGSEDPAEVHGKLTCVLQRLSQQYGMIEEMIVEKAHSETGVNRGKVRKMLGEVRSQAEAAGKACMREQYKNLEAVGQEKKIVTLD